MVQMTSQQKRVILLKRVTLALIVVVIFVMILISTVPRSLSFSAHQKPPIHVRQRTPLLLFVGIFSAPIYLARRNAVRQTWGTRCVTREDIVCWFITDGQDVNGKPLQGKIKLDIDNESRLYDDLLFAESPGGINFARRYLWMIEWAFQRYMFKYILRVDDDYFICLDKLLLELRDRPKRKLAWGWLYCALNKVIIDEGFIIVTQDIITSFLNRSSKLLCHPSGSQALAMWLKDVPGLVTFGDNERIFHHQIDFIKTAGKSGEMCGAALAIHQTTPKEMRLFWNVSLKEDYQSYILPPIAFPCQFPHIYNYKVSTGRWFAKPKLCKDMPVWNRGEYFISRREKGKKEISSWPVYKQAGNLSPG